MLEDDNSRNLAVSYTDEEHFLLCAGPVLAHECAQHSVGADLQDDGAFGNAFGGLPKQDTLAEAVHLRSSQKHGSGNAYSGSGKPWWAPLAANRGPCNQASPGSLGLTHAKRFNSKYGRAGTQPPIRHYHPELRLYMHGMLLKVIATGRYPGNHMHLVLGTIEVGQCFIAAWES